MHKIVKQKLEENPFASLWSIVYEILLEKIITFEIKPNTTLTETNLSKCLNVSRTPVKVALDRLVEEKLVYKKEGKGYLVSELTRDELFNIIDFRIAIEGEAAYLTAKRIKAGDLETLRKELEEIKKCSNLENLDNFPEADHRFHTTIVKAAGNPMLYESYHNFEFRIKRYRYQFKDMQKKLDPDLEFLGQNHEPIYNSIRLGFSSVARKEIINDIKTMHYSAALLKKAEGESSK